MSAGQFTRTKYESNDGTIFGARVQPETLAATIGGTANAAPAGDFAFKAPSANMGGGRRENGVNARYVSFQWDDGGAPANYLASGTGRLPILTPAVFNSINIGDAVVYAGGTGVVTGTIGESIK